MIISRPLKLLLLVLSTACPAHPMKSSCMIILGHHRHCILRRDKNEGRPHKTQDNSCEIERKSHNHYHHLSRRLPIWFRDEGSSQIKKISMIASRPRLGISLPIFPDKHSINEGDQDPEKDLITVTVGPFLINIDKGLR